MNNQSELTNKQKFERPCEDGDRVCIGDRVHVCEKGKWKPTGTFCVDDN